MVPRDRDRGRTAAVVEDQPRPLTPVMFECC